MSRCTATVCETHKWPTGGLDRFLFTDTNEHTRQYAPHPQNAHKENQIGKHGKKSNILLAKEHCMLTPVSFSCCCNSVDAIFVSASVLVALLTILQSVISDFAAGAVPFNLLLACLADDASFLLSSLSLPLSSSLLLPESHGGIFDRKSAGLSGERQLCSRASADRVSLRNALSWNHNSSTLPMNNFFLRRVAGHSEE